MESVTLLPLLPLQQLLPLTLLELLRAPGDTGLCCSCDFSILASSSSWAHCCGSESSFEQC